MPWGPSRVVGNADHTPRDHIHVYEPAEMPNVEVQLEDGTWVEGEGRMHWQGRETGVWWIQVRHRAEPNTRMINRFLADRVRPTTVRREPSG